MNINTDLSDHLDWAAASPSDSHFDSINSNDRRNHPTYSRNSLGTDSNGSLVIDGATRGNEGRYLCQAMNQVGASLSKIITITVHGEPNNNNI